MKSSFVLAAAAALCFAGCKKQEGSPTGAGSAVAAGPAVAKAAEPAAKPKSCEELGGTKQRDTCIMKTPAPVDVAFSGKFDTDMMHPEPGALFKVTNKLAVPIKVQTTQLYAYDKAGKQLDLDIRGSKSKYSQESSGGLIELAPNETKDYVHSIGKKNLPDDMDALQVEVLSWSQDGKDFERASRNDDVRPKDGWK